MAIAPLPRRTVSPHTSHRAAVGVLFFLVSAAAIAMALLLGTGIWHVLLELGLLVGLVFLVQLLVKNVIAILRDEP